MEGPAMRKTQLQKMTLLCASFPLTLLACKTRSFGGVKLIHGSRQGAENYPALTRIKIDGKTHCTAGKVGEQLFITAAHCVTQAGFRQGVYYGVAPSRPTIPRLVTVGPSELRRAHHFQRFMRMILIEVGSPHAQFA